MLPPLPRLVLVPMNIVLLRKFTKRQLSTCGYECYLLFEVGCEIMAWASCNYSSPVEGKTCQLQAKNPLILTV